MAEIPLCGNFDKPNLLFSSTCIEQKHTFRPHP